MSQKIRRGAKKSYSTLLIFLLAFAFYVCCNAHIK